MLDPLTRAVDGRLARGAVSMTQDDGNGTWLVALVGEHDVATASSTETQVNRQAGSLRVFGLLGLREVFSCFPTQQAALAHPTSAGTTR